MDDWDDRRCVSNLSGSYTVPSYKNPEGYVNVWRRRLSIEPSRHPVIHTGNLAMVEQYVLSDWDLERGER